MTAASVPVPQRSEVVPPPSGVTWVTPVLAFIGLGLSIYLTVVHFQPNALNGVCSESGGINCLKVTTSWESRFLGIPIVFLGLAQYLAMTVLCLPLAWRSTRREVHLARLVLATVGMCFVLWLLAAELLLIGSICLYCTGVHIVTFALFVCMVTTVPGMLGWTER